MEYRKASKTGQNRTGTNEYHMTSTNNNKYTIFILLLKQMYLRAVTMDLTYLRLFHILSDFVQIPVGFFCPILSAFLTFTGTSSPLIFSLSVGVALVSLTNLLIGNDKMVFIFMFTAEAVNGWLKIQSQAFGPIKDIISFLAKSTQTWRCIYFASDVRWCGDVWINHRRHHHQQLNHHLITFRLLLMKRPANQWKLLDF